MLESGAILSHYNIISAIGAGGMGEVYRAADTKLGREVALKVLLPEVAADPDRVQRFVQEAKAASALNHPNILTVFEVGNFDQSRYIATELIKGETLRERIKGGSLSVREALDISLQVTAALGAAHEAGIIHRDLKPENIMIRHDGLVKVLDFGLAKLLPTAAESLETTLPQLNTKPGVIVGTVAYMSPEQARGRKLDPRSDIFSFGIVLFELFTGKRPFAGESHLDLISSILKDEPPLLCQLAPNLPPQLERIISKTLRKDRDHRYQHIKDLHIDIEDLRDELKFEEAFNRRVQPTTTDAAIHETNQSSIRSALTTGISKTRRFTLLHALIFIALAAAAVSGLWYFGASGPTITGPYKATEIASWNSSPGELGISASFSPDGKMIAFASTKSGSKNIWVTQTTSTEPIQVTNDAFSNVDPIWSPKGDEIAFLSQRGNAAGSSSTGIWRVSALGGISRSVGVPSGGSKKLRRWVKSGRIYYQSDSDLYAVDPASGNSQKITSFSDPKIRWISISPDEKSVAYSRQNDGDWQIFVGDALGEKPIEIAKNTGRLDDVVWLPEKERLFYSATEDGVVRVFVTEIGSGTVRRITSAETDTGVVDSTADGRSIIFSSSKEESNLWRISVADGAELPVARDLNVKLWPAVSPDNQRIVFQSIRNLSSGNKLVDGSIAVKSSRQREDGEVPNVLATPGFLPSWSPDGSAILFLRPAGDRTELISVNANGGGEKRLSGSLPVVGHSISPYNYLQARAFMWSPDGTRIAYISEEGGLSNVLVTLPGNDSGVAITDNLDADLLFFCPVWSSDGKKIAFYYQRKTRNSSGKTIRGLRIVDVENKSISDILETTKLIRLVGWAPDGSGLITAESSKDFSSLPPETILTRVSIADGKETTIASLKNIYFYNIFLSEDRKTIAYAAREQGMDDLWTIPASGGSPRKLTKNNDPWLYYSRLAWFPDGSSIIFSKQTRFSLLSLVTDID